MSRRQQRGFTIIELLTVIGIILFMIAVIAAVALNTRKNAQIKATQTLVQRIGIALELYYSNLREYPPDNGFGIHAGGTSDPFDSKLNGTEVLYDNGSLWRYLGQEIVQRRADNSVIRTLGPFVQGGFKDGEIVEYTDTKYGKSYVVIDIWKTMIGYRGDPRRVIWNRGSVDVYSAGPDKKTGYNDGIDNDNDGATTECGQDLACNNADDAPTDGIIDNAPEFGEGIYNGALTGAKKIKPASGKEVLDDINNWDPQH